MTLQTKIKPHLKKAIIQDPHILPYSKHFLKAAMTIEKEAKKIKPTKAKEKLDKVTKSKMLRMLRKRKKEIYKNLKETKSPALKHLYNSIVIMEKKFK